MRISCLCVKQSLNDKYIICTDVNDIFMLLGIFEAYDFQKEIRLMMDKDVHVVFCIEIYSSITIY